MPELPEVETIRRDLEKEVVGKRIKQVEVTGLRSIRRHGSKKPFVARLEGRKVVGVARRGKYLLVRLEGTDVLVVHLGMSGQLLWSKGGKEEKAKHTHVVVTFAPPGGGQLRFLDPRTFGELFVTSWEDLDDAVPELAHLGFDPVEQAISWTHFGELLQARRRKLKDLLMDQKFIAGIGNLYSDEILWSAGLRYDRSSEDLTSQEIRRLYRSMSEILHDAIKHRGSSLADEQYRDLYGAVGGYAAEHNVYDREGQPCRRCRTPIQRIKYGGRSHFFCPRCQI
jgi:formamidopyrimidine-DNA glycosylase